MIFEALFAGQDYRGHQHVVESRLETVFVAVPDDDLARARLIELEQGAIVIVIVLARAVVSEQNREKAQRRNIVTGHFQARSQRSRQQQAWKPP